MPQSFSVVNGFLPTARDDTNVRDEIWSYALGQREFGPRQLWLMLADADGAFRGLAYTKRTDPFELALDACFRYFDQGRPVGARRDPGVRHRRSRPAPAAVVLCDEMVPRDLPADLAEQLQRARAVAASYGSYLVDWIACDDELFRSAQLSLDPDGDWWPLSGDRAE